MITTLKSKSGSNCLIDTDMPNEIYHSMDEYWGSSMLRSLYNNSKKYKYLKIKTTPVMQFGTDFDYYLLQNDLFNKLYIIYDEDKRQDTTKTMSAKINIAWKKEIIEEANSEGKSILSKSDLLDFEGMRDSIFAWRKNGYYPIKLWVENNEAQVSYFIDDFNGIKAKIRPDLLIKQLSILGDLKVTHDASTIGFKQMVKAMSYDLQIAYYKDIYEEITSIEQKTVFWLCVEPKYPYCFNPIEVPEKAIESGRLGYTLAIEKAKNLLLSYDGYPDSIPDGKYFNQMDWNDWDTKRWLK